MKNIAVFLHDAHPQMFMCTCLLCEFQQIPNSFHLLKAVVQETHEADWEYVFSLQRLHCNVELEPGQSWQPQQLQVDRKGKIEYLV